MQSQPETPDSQNENIKLNEVERTQSVVLEAKTKEDGNVESVEMKDGKPVVYHGESYQFQDSVNQFLIYYGHGGWKKVGDPGHPGHDENGVFLALVTHITVWTVIGMMLSQALEESPDFSSGDAEIQYFFIGSWLIGMWLVSDITSSVKGYSDAPHWFGKFGCTLILFTTALACYAAGMFAMLGAAEGNSYDAVSNTVGVLFVVDIDEKIYTTYLAVAEVADQPWVKKGLRMHKCARKTRSMVCMFAFIFLMMLLAMTAGLIAIAHHSIYNPED